MENAFELKGLVKRYPKFELGPLDLSLEPGVVLGYIGPNGSGKTTTMHCITGLVRSDKGSVRIFGREANSQRPAWKHDVGYVGDAHVFYERWTAEGNLKFLSQFFPSWSDKRALDLARRFQLPLDRRAKDLSSGNRVKLSLVGVLARSPRLLLLDEPTAGLDPIVRTEVLETLFEVLESGECSIFYSTHILSDISRLADELLFLNDGHLGLRAKKEDLTEQWRKISFRIRSGSLPNLPSVSNHRQEGEEHQIWSSDYPETLEALQATSAESIRLTRMTIDEITVEILKGGANVASN